MICMPLSTWPMKRQMQIVSVMYVVPGLCKGLLRLPPVLTGLAARLRHGTRGTAVHRHPAIDGGEDLASQRAQRCSRPSPRWSCTAPGRHAARRPSAVISRRQAASPRPEPSRSRLGNYRARRPASIPATRADGAVGAGNAALTVSATRGDDPDEHHRCHPGRTGHRPSGQPGRRQPPPAPGATAADGDPASSPGTIHPPKVYVAPRATPSRRPGEATGHELRHPCLTGCGGSVSWPVRLEPGPRRPRLV